MTPPEIVRNLRQLRLAVHSQPPSRFVSGAAFDAWGDAEALLFDAVYALGEVLEMPAPSEHELWLDAVHSRQDADVDFDDDLVREMAAFAPREAA